MDRDLDTKEKRTNQLRRAIAPALALAALITALALIPGYLTPKLQSTDLRIAEVQIADIASTLAAEGRVVPEYEEVVTSPIEARVTRILLRPGAKVDSTDVILELDTEAARTAVQALDQRIALQENAIAKSRLLLDQSLVDLESQIRVKELERDSFEFTAKRNTTLLEKGLIVEDELRAARTDLARTTIELEQLKRSATNEKKKLEVELEGLEIEISILRGERAEAQQRLERARAHATHPGVLTAVLPTEGEAVRVGDELARVADLGRFRVEASFGDVHAQRLAAGQPVRMRINDDSLEGAISRVLPAVENGAVKVEIRLDQPSHPALRQNLRLEVEVVTEERPHTLVVERGAVVHYRGERCLYVLEGDRARRRRVRIGLANLATHEIVEGLNAGDRVILNDMSEYSSHEEVEVQ